MARSSESFDGPRAPRRPSPAWLAAMATLLGRGLFAAWAWGKFPPVADGRYYAVLADRLARGLGSTWQWPDGAVTFAAHYPVGLPALLAFFERWLGSNPTVVLVPSVMLGVLGAGAIADAAARFASPRTALAAGVAFGLHPALVSYLPAVMTEGITASFIAIAMALALRCSDADRPVGPRVFESVLLGVAIGAATYVRPQSISLLAMAPIVMVAQARSRGAGRSKTAASAGVLALSAIVALGAVAPWTARNCEKMGRCALVSVNGGWNLLIGTDPSARGTWAPLEVPPACRSVFDEAEKDACFGHAARETIARAPAAWLALVPSKWAATFDYLGAGPWYLHDSAPGHFGERAKWAWGAAEVVVHRSLLALGLFAATARRGGWRFVFTALALLPAGWVATLALCVVALAEGLRSRSSVRVSEDAVAGWSGAMAASGLVVATTALVHATFFGAGRYGLVVVPAIVLLAAGNGLRRADPAKPF
jgi:hypothetical protein